MVAGTASLFPAGMSSWSRMLSTPDSALVTSVHDLI
jgi:hypothetical protein